MRNLTYYENQGLQNSAALINNHENDFTLIGRWMGYNWALADAGLRDTPLALISEFLLELALCLNPATGEMTRPLNERALKLIDKLPVATDSRPWEVQI